MLYINILKTSCVISAWSFGIFIDLNYLLNTTIADDLIAASESKSVQGGI